MATRKINRKKNFTQRKKYKKRGNKLLNTQKRIRKQSKNKSQIKKPVNKKETFKIIKCPKCKGAKQLKISKKKLDKLRNAGMSTDEIYKKLTGMFCCGDIFGTSSEKYDHHIIDDELHRGLEGRRQNIINLRNRRLSSSSVVSNNSSSSSYRTANEGSSPTPPNPPPIKEESSYILVKDSPNTVKKQWEYDSEDSIDYNKKLLAQPGEGSIDV
jgi:hypothetical protein